MKRYLEIIPYDYVKTSSQSLLIDVYLGTTGAEHRRGHLWGHPPEGQRFKLEKEGDEILVLRCGHPKVIEQLIRKTRRWSE